jgi:hypothetical protein
LGPVSTILQAHWILGEHIFIAQIIGTFLVIAGVLLIGLETKYARNSTFLKAAEIFTDFFLRLPTVCSVLPICHFYCAAAY